MTTAAGLLLAASTTLVLLSAGCQTRPPPKAELHYVLGPNYQADGVWRTPQEDFSLDETGLVSITGTHGPITTDGETFDPTALAASHPTLQLPAIARITDLQTGRSVLVRINDRGPASPARMAAVTRRTAELLGATGDAPLRARLQVQEDASRQLTATLHADAPLAVATAAPAGVQSESLAPPGGATSSTRGHVVPSAAQPVAATPAAAAAAIPLRLSEQVNQGAPAPGQLLIDCGGFGRQEYAGVLQSRLASLGARLTTSYSAPRDRAYRVQIGPLADVAAAEAMQLRALRAGATDARIVVE